MKIDVAVKEISKLLGQKFWFGGKLVHPWDHPLNKIKNCICLTLDGCVSYKFKLCKNGKLRVHTIRDSGYLNLHLKRLQTITFQDLYCRIALQDNKYAGCFLQLTSPIPVPVDRVAMRDIDRARRYAEKLMGKM
jgi:hypothetical protein